MNLHIDHLVLTVRDLDAAIHFYNSVLGMQVVEFSGGRKALKFGRQKMNLHQYGKEFTPHASQPTPGSMDLCFLTDLPIATVTARLKDIGVEIEAGPVPRSGAAGPIQSIYFREPDGNLIEIANAVS